MKKKNMDNQKDKYNKIKTATIDEIGRIKESKGKERKMGWEGV